MDIWNRTTKLFVNDNHTVNIVDVRTSMIPSYKIEYCLLNNR